MGSLFLACREVFKYRPCFKILVFSLFQIHPLTTLASNTLHYKIQHRYASIANISLWSIKRSV